MQGFCPLASGSKGNSIYFGTKTTRLLIDAGISAKATSEKLQEIGVDLSTIDAILISHEHIDHIRGLTSLACKNNLPVFANADTAKAIIEILGVTPRFKIFSTGESFEFGDIEIHPFSVQHDTLDPVAFTLKTNSLKIGICTDLGFGTTLVKNHLKQCDYLYIEANHQPSMVLSCSRPPIYKQRVLSRQGHLSNDQCAEILAEVAHSNLKHIHLAHLSQECNHPDLALQIVHQKLGEAGHTIDISIAYQEQVSRSILF
jgi:phosphoribosyl 1,2-cyclic phosphodiesterase